jgi:hypothetical protein
MALDEKCDDFISFKAHIHRLLHENEAGKQKKKKKSGWKEESNKSTLTREKGCFVISSLILLKGLSSITPLGLSILLLLTSESI